MTRADARTPGWAWLALGAVALLAAVLFVWQLDRSGYANAYYSAAVLAGTQSWSAFFFGSFDAANFITVDKPPLSLWVMGLSARLFGLNAWSLLLPEALAGVATVVILFDAVRRSFGHVQALIAALVLALTPVAVLMFRYNNPEALLTLLLVIAAWALVRALERGRTSWLLVSATAGGLAFNTKYLQADIAVPALALAYLVAAPVGLRRRIAQLGASAIGLAVTSSWWMVIVDAVPASSRPYIGGSSTNSVLDLVIGYDGLGRIFGNLVRRRVVATDGPGTIFDVGPGLYAPPGLPFGGGFGGAPGPLRLFNAQMGGDISWLIPFALVALACGLVIRARAPRTDASRAGYLLWGAWLLLHAAVFSFATGNIHAYYTVLIAPAVGALVGAGVVELWRVGSRRLLAAAALAAGVVGTAAWGSELLRRTPTFVPGLATALLAISLVAAALVMLSRIPRLGRTTLLAGAALGVVAILAGPTAYSLATVVRAYEGGDPRAGPATASTLGPAGSAFPGPSQGGSAGQRFPVARDATGAIQVIGAASRTVDDALVRYLVRNRGQARWIVAVTGANEAASIELAAGQPVMAMGGFSGSDPVPSLEQFKTLAASGELRFVLSGRGPSVLGRFGAASGGSSAVGQWVIQNCDLVTVGSAKLYDCAGSASAD